MATFFTSDTHFNHARIIEYSGRPFANVEEMNEEMIRRWNATVMPDDTVYHLGDFAMGPKVEHQKFFDRLNGRKIIILGNHDQKPAKMHAMGWAEVHTTLSLPTRFGSIYLAHIPLRDDPYENRWYPTPLTPTPPGYDYWLCGHVHEKFSRRGNVINVGVDVRDFTPRTLEYLIHAI